MTPQTTPLRTLAKLQAGMPTTGESFAGGGGTPVITVRAMHKGCINDGEVRSLNPEASDGIDERYRLQADDLLIPARSTSVQTALVPQHLDGAVFNATLIRIRCNRDQVAPALLKAYLDHPDGRAQVEGVSQSGTHQMNVTVTALGEIEIPIPPITQQATLVATLNQADRAYTTSIEAARRRRILSQDIIVRKMRGEPSHAGARS